MCGNVGIGGINPIRVQSMTTTDTMNTKATVEQSIRMIEAGCELVRITAPSINEAKNLNIIRNELRARGYETPLVADIHFTPNAAEWAARVVEKIRINPGNYADKKKFEVIEYTEQEYNAELERIRSRFIPLVRICKEHGTAMRIGTNHGSLSDRIMSRYGDTPLGMVESALEFLRICEDESYRNIVLSMKSSNPQVMVQAYRLLVQRMNEENMDYPLHLGVTEAGEGEDGRIKSAVGIGSLLEDGIGDTVRVSLTEDPEFEIPVAKMLVAPYSTRAVDQLLIPDADITQLAYSPYEYTRRESDQVLNIGGSHVPVVISDFSNFKSISYQSLLPLGYRYSEKLDKWNISDQACDYMYTGNHYPEFEIPGTLSVILNYKVWKIVKDRPRFYPLFENPEQYFESLSSAETSFVRVRLSDIISFTSRAENKNLKKIVFVAETENPNAVAELRRLFFELSNHEKLSRIPVIIHRSYKDFEKELFQIRASSESGPLLLDGFGDGLWLNSGEKVSLKDINSVSFGILQATRTRISKTEYISCPSCGRTLFDLQETTAKIRERTDHLKGLKIGIMGCIVNGPGEMADADYGYVGTGPGKITLYKGKEVVRRNIDEDKAVEELINLIREHGDWVDAGEMNTLKEEI